MENNNNTLEDLINTCEKMIVNKNDADLITEKFISKVKQDSKKHHKKDFSKDSKDKIKTCYLCGSKNHLKRDCWSFKVPVRKNNIRRKYGNYTGIKMCIKNKIISHDSETIEQSSKMVK